MMTPHELLELLKAKCAESSQASVARQLGYKPSTICQILNGSYPGSPENVLAKVEEIFGGTMVNCPVVGEITLRKCREHQDRPFAATNPLRVRLYRACRECGER